MTRSLISALLLLGLAGVPLAAQAPSAPSPAARRGPGRGFQRGPRFVSPQVNADDTLTLRFYAPNAHQVSVVGEIDGKAHPMTKAANGVWSVTIGPLAPDVYNYQFNVDGVIAMDPHNPSVKLGFGAFPPANLVEIPVRSGEAFDDAQQVPHGTVRIETYYSKAIGAPRTLWIYTPPGYDHSTRRYPVFYLLHGSGNIDSSWVLTGRENYIMDNLIASHRAEPMIIVNPLGYAREGVGLGPLTAADLAAEGEGTSPMPSNNRGGDSLFAKDLLDDVIPFVQSHYRTLDTANDRALGGLSMGGGQTVAIGFTHTGVFHSLVVMSAGAQNADKTYPSFFANPATTNRTLRLLWIGVGGADPIAGAGAHALDATLTAHGIHHDFWILPGARHEWVVWRHALDVVAPLLFRPAAAR